MTQTVNINGQELELEQCVIDGDELDIAFQGDLDYYNDIDFLLKTREECEGGIGLPIVEVPEDEQFIKEYIESNLDSQIDDQVFDKLLEELDKEPDVMPIAMSYSEWLLNLQSTKEYIRGIEEGITKSPDYWIIREFNRNKNEYIQSLDTEDNKTLYDKYLLGVRRELREWWFRNSKNALFVPDSREAWKEGDDLSYIQDPLIPENPIIKN